MMTLLSHTSHALQPLDVACFKLFKTTFRKEGDVAIVNNNYIELDKITLVSWVEKTLDLSFTTKNILSRFRVSGIWPLSLIAMHEKINPNNLYITNNTTTNNR